MTNEPPTSFDTVGDAPVEARIVAWVLGEASHFEAAELERLCEERPELLVFRHRMRALHGLLTEAEAAEPDLSWKLSPEKQKILDEIFGGENTAPIRSGNEGRAHDGRRALLGIAACLAISFIAFQLIPKNYEAEAIIEIKPQILESSPFEETQSIAAGSSPMTPQFFGTEFEKIKSRQSLEKVIANLDLTKRWGVDQESALKRVMDSIKTKNIRGTDLISVRVSETNEDDAKDITHEVIQSYKEYRKSINHKENDRQLAELNQAVQDQEDKVEERRKLLASIVRTKAIIYKGQDSFYGQSGVDGDQKIMKDDSREEANKRGLDAQDYVDAKRDFETDQQLLQKLRLKQIGKQIARKTLDEPIVVHQEPTRTKTAGLSDQSLAENTAKPASPASHGQYPIERKSKERSLGTVQAKEQAQLARQSAQRQLEAEPSVAAPSTALPDVGASSSITPMEPIAGSLFSRSAGSGALGGGYKLAQQDESIPLAKMDRERESQRMDDPIRTNPALTYEHPRNVDQMRRDLSMAEGNFNLGKNDDSKRAYNKVLKIDPYNSNAHRGLEKIAQAKSDSHRAAYDHTRAELLSQVDSPFELAVPSDGTSKADDPAPPQESIPAEENEALADLIQETPASESPYSTFSLNISDASFQLAKAALAKGERPDPAAIKPEQFYNAVDYGDPAPHPGESVSAAIEQSVHPLIPARNWVRIALRTAADGRSAIQPLRLTLLVDQSGSMVREDRRAAMEHALSQLSVLLTKNDLVTVIGFSRTSRLLADGMTGDQATKLGDLINQSASEGGTNLEEAIKLGGQLAERHYLGEAQNRIVLFTDGAANLGDANPARLAGQVKALRQNGLAFDIAGIGADGLNDRMLSELARSGNGRYYIVGNDKNDSLARQLAGAFRPAAGNVKVQVNFNPQRVRSYKLIGFEKDRLKTEDFRNDAVDAAELAAAEAGVAIYQVEPIIEGTGELGEVSVRFKDTNSGEMIERTWTMHYETAASAFDRATPSMQLAGLSLLAAEKLRGGPLGDAIDFKQLTHSTSLVKEVYGNSTRVAEMLQVIDSLR